MKITRENLKNIVREAMVEENAYQEFFKKALEKTGKSIPDMSDEEKKAFFNKIDSAWKGKGEKKESVEEIEEEAVVVSKRTPEGNIVSKLKEELESVNEEIKVGSSVTVNYPTLKKPVMGKVKHILKSPTGLVYVLDGDKGVWDAKNVSLKESVNEKADPKKFTKGFERGDVIVNDDNSRYVVVAQRGKQFIVGDNGERREFNKGKVGNKKLKGNLSLKNVLGESVNESVNDFFKLANLMISIRKYKKGTNKKDITKDVHDYFGVSGDLSKSNVVKLSNHIYKMLNEESTNERMGSDKGAVGNANFNNRLKAMRDDRNSVVAFIDTNKGKKLLKVFKTQQTAKQFTKKNMDKLLNTKGVESVGTMSKKEWDAKEAKYAIESVNEAESQGINKGDKVVVNYPNLTKPVKGVVGQILKSANGNVIVLKGDGGVWDEKFVTKQ